MTNFIVKISIVLCLIFLVNAQQILHSQDVKGENFLFSFGSCFSQRRLTALNKTSIFEKISEKKPDVFAWLGDFGYPKLFENFIPAFEFTKNEKGYKMLQNNNVTQIVGVWDDHDYGRNDGDKNYKHKHETRKIYLDYIGEPIDSIRRTQPGGIYTSYYLGNTKKVKLVLLDVRFSRDAFWFEHSDILGKLFLLCKILNKLITGPDQWKWLEKEFNDPNSHTIILASGCQILPDDRVIPEKWYPDSRNRLFDLIQKHKDHQRVILISGDIHLAEILVEPNSVSRFGYNIIEITSSGLTHHIMDYKVPQFIVDGFLPNTFNEKQNRLMDFNYALVDIKINPQNKENTQLEFSINDQNNISRLKVKFEPWKQEQKQLNLTNSKYTREDHRYKRWIIWMFKNYFVEYRKIGIALTIFGLIILALAYFISSCFAFDRQQKHGPISLFHNITKHDPDVFAWLGDAAYVYNFTQAQQLFDSTTNDPGYQKLLQNKQTKIIGIWDDHDYGVNDGDRLHQYKEEMREIFLNFLKEPKNSIRRTQQDGIYTSYYLGHTKQVKLVMLDVRYSRDPYGKEATEMLGEAQWIWLDKEFQDKNANIILLTSGIQVLPDDRLVTEYWYNQSRQRLFDLFKKYKDTKRVVILSGDVHFAEILQEPDSIQTIGYNLFEITSSGISHSLGYSKYPTFFINTFLPNTYNEKKDRLFDLNYAVADIQIDLASKNNTKIHFTIYDKHENPKLSIIIKPWEIKNEQITKTFLNRSKNYMIRFALHAFRNYFFDYGYIGISSIVLIYIIIKTIQFLINFIFKMFSQKLKAN
ncbi:hypothetical protein ABPG74_012540 [Tetrahymena malaccensis]